MRLPSLSAAHDRRRHRRRRLPACHRRAEQGTGVILALPHLGGWEWAGRWLSDLGYPVTVVVERIEPPELFDWFIELRAKLGMTVLPLGPDVGRAMLQALKQQRDRLPALRPRHRRRRRRGRVLRRAHDAARRPGHAGAAHRRTDPAGRRVLHPPGSTATSRRPPAAPDGATGTPPRRRRPDHPGPRRRARVPDPPGPRPVAHVPTELAERPRVRRVHSRDGPTGSSGRRRAIACPHEAGAAAAIADGTCSAGSASARPLLRGRRPSPPGSQMTRIALTIPHDSMRARA